jgi:putative transposase
LSRTSIIDPKPDRVWNRIPDDVRERIVNLALDESALSPRELAVRFTDTEGYFVSEASVYGCSRPTI